MNLLLRNDVMWCVCDIFCCLRNKRCAGYSTVHFDTFSEKCIRLCNEISRGQFSRKN